MPAPDRAAIPPVVHDDMMGDDLSLRSLFTAAWRGRWILLLCTAAGAFAGFRKVQEQGDIWKAESRLYIQGQAPTVMGADGLLASGARNFANTQAAVLRSVSLLQSVVLRPDVGGSSIFEEETNKVGWLRENLKVKVGRDDDVLSISLQSQEVEEATIVVNAVVEEFRTFLGQRGESTVKEMLTVKSEGRDALQKELDVRMTARREFLEENELLAADPNGTAAYENSVLREYREALSLAEREHQAAAARLDEAQLLKDNPEALMALVSEARVLLPASSEALDPDLLDLNEDIDAAEDEAERLQQRRIELRRSMTANHPAITQLDEQLSTLLARSETLRLARDRYKEATTKADRTQQEDETTKLLAFLEKRVEVASAKEAREQQRVDDQRNVTTLAGRLFTEYGRLDGEVERVRGMLDEVAAEVSELNLAEIGNERMNEMTVDVLDPASPNTATLASSKTRTLAQFVILGLLAGAALTWLRTMLDHKIRSEEDLARVIPVPLIGVLPKANIRQDKVDAVRGWAEQRALAEAARGLRTAIYFSLPKEEGQIIHLTSPDKGDGKSTVTAYLAIAMAQAGQTVLVIDGDLRSPRQNKIFHLDNEVGLSDALIDTDVPLSDLIVQSELAGLDILPTGPIPSAPAEMLNSRRFQDLLIGLSGIYDRILVDSPPVLAVTDSRVIATKCNATILVTRVDKSTRDAAGAAFERLHSVGANMLGVVLNAMPKGIGYGYGYGGGYGYGYGRQYGDPIPESKSRTSNAAWIDTEATSGPFDESERSVVALPTDARHDFESLSPSKPQPAKAASSAHSEELAAAASKSAAPSNGKPSPRRVAARPSSKRRQP
jgi:capsular exopolysaccharide synthesis family protein